MTDGMRQLKYLLESHVAWKPDEPVVMPWEVGLMSKVGVRKVIRANTMSIHKAVEHDTGRIHNPRK